MEKPTPRVECSGCGGWTEITDPTDMPARYCPECGERRRVKINAQTPDDTKTSRI